VWYLTKNLEHTFSTSWLLNLLQILIHRNFRNKYSNCNLFHTLNTLNLIIVFTHTTHTHKNVCAHQCSFVCTTVIFLFEMAGTISWCNNVFFHIILNALLNVLQYPSQIIQQVSTNHVLSNICVIFKQSSCSIRNIILALISGYHLVLHR
jgi:hypothetical protein